MPGCAALVQAGRCPAHGGTGKATGSWATPSVASSLRDRGRPWRRLREQVLSEEYRCYRCGVLGEADDIVDHLVPLAQGGTDDRHNLARCCRRCHNQKTAAESAGARG